MTNNMPNNYPFALELRLTRRPRSRRQGMSLLIVLAMIAITMGASYAVLRSQTTAIRVQSNATRHGDARNATIVGITTAMRAMSGNTWAGVGTTFEGRLSDTEGYVVSFTTGDPGLSAGAPEYDDFPYRVTILSTGFAVDPANSHVRSEHRIRTVVRLVPRALSTAPANWPDLGQETVFQWDDNPAVVEIPVQIEGSARLHGPLRLCEDYPPVTRPFDGLIDEVALFDRALSKDEIEDIYEAALDGDGDLTDAYEDADPDHWWRLNELPGATVAADSAGGASGSIEGAEPGNSGVPIGMTNRALRFDGKNDYVNVGSIDVSGNGMTILAWFKANSFANRDARILSKATGTPTSKHHWMLSTTKSHGAYRLRFRVRTGTRTKTLVARSGSLSTDVWVFAAAVYDGSKMRLYKNGNQVGSTGKSGTLAQDPTIPVWIGDNPPGSPRVRYLRDLEAMRVAGQGDFRPFTGPLAMSYSDTDDFTLSLVQEELRVPTSSIANPSFSAPISHPGSVTAYQLFPGGKTYEIPVLDSSLSNVSLTADPASNPLGVYYHSGRVDIYNNVKIQGTIITDGSQPDLYIHGANVHLKPATLPPLDGTTTPIQLPTAYIDDDLRIQDSASGSIGGMVVTWDDFEIEKGNDNVTFDIEGRLLVKELKLKGCWQWDKGDEWWQSRLHDFYTQLNDPETVNPEPYFPRFMESSGLDPESLLTIRPESIPVAYHWHNWDQPVYVPHPDDEGLRWHLLEWTDNAE